MHSPGVPPAAAGLVPAGGPDPAILGSEFRERYMRRCSSELRVAALACLGIAPESTVDEVSTIPLDVIERDLREIAVIGDPPVKLSAMQIGLVRRAFLTMFDELRGPAPPPVAQALPPPPPPAAYLPLSEDPLVTRFSLVLNQTYQGSFHTLSSDALAAARQLYEDVRGNVPEEEARPTDRQLSALAAWLHMAPGGRKRAPGVDMGVWVPYGERLYEELAFAPRQMRADGEWVIPQIRGPKSFAYWESCWKVFEAAMIMLNAASPASLQAYHKGIRILNGRWPSEWAAIQRADVAVRTSQWSRLLEDGLAARPPTVIQNERVWDQIIKDSAWQEAYRGPLAAFWERTLTFTLTNGFVPAGTVSFVTPSPVGEGGGGGGAPPAPERGTKAVKGACFNCGVPGHPWWECTPKTGRALNPVLAKQLKEFNAAPGPGGGRGGRGGRGNGRGDASGRGRGYHRRSDDGSATPDANDAQAPQQENRNGKGRGRGRRQQR